MRVKIEDAFRVAYLHGFEHGERALARLAAADLFMGAQGFHDLAADGHDRVQRIFRVLQDHGHALAAHDPPLFCRRLEQINIAEAQRIRLDARIFGRQPHDGAAGLRFAGTGFADDAETLAPEREGHAAHRLHQPGAGGEGHAQVLNGQKRRTHWPASLGSSASRRPSPRRLKPRLTMRIATPGMAATHH